MSVEAEVAARLAAVRERIERAAKRAGRDPGGVTLVGVVKRQAPERVAAGLAAGLRDLGESYVQEALRRADTLRVTLEGLAPPPVRWHLVGRLQRNKARDAVRRFDCIHSLDREPLAVELSRRAEELGRPVEALLQVNLSGEAQKGGAPPEALAALLARCAELPGLHVVGLMTVPALAAEAEASRPAFAALRRLRDELGREPGGAALRELSMGMSGDFEVAIEEGATIVRIGSAIFGPREASA